MGKKFEELDEWGQVRFRHVLRTVGIRVRARRKAKNMSLRQFAAVVGVRPATVCGIEAGSINLSLMMLFMIAHALDVDLAVLLEGTVIVGCESSGDDVQDTSADGAEDS